MTYYTTYRTPLVRRIKRAVINARVRFALWQADRRLQKLIKID